jgi:thiol-disulfide isomerase/thioredoxin
MRSILLVAILAGVLALVTASRTGGWRLDVDATFDRINPPRPAPLLSFRTRDGHWRSLGDFRGKFVLVNLWATWCPPCVREMPSLDRAQRKLGERLHVLAIAEDSTGEAAVGPFLAARPPLRFTVLLDSSNDGKRAFDVHGIPTSILIDRSGRIVASLVGEVDWDSPRVIAELERYIAEDDRRLATDASTPRSSVPSARY